MSSIAKTPSQYPRNTRASRKNIAPSVHSVSFISKTDLFLNILLIISARASFKNRASKEIMVIRASFFRGVRAIIEVIISAARDTNMFFRVWLCKTLSVEMISCLMDCKQGSLKYVMMFCPEIESAFSFYSIRDFNCGCMAWKIIEVCGVVWYTVP